MMRQQKIPSVTYCLLTVKCKLTSHKRIWANSLLLYSNKIFELCMITGILSKLFFQHLQLIPKFDELYKQCNVYLILFIKSVDIYYWTCTNNQYFNIYYWCYLELSYIIHESQISDIAKWFPNPQLIKLIFSALTQFWV